MKIVPSDAVRRQELINEARQISVAYPVLEPMLEKRIEGAMKRIISNFRNGKESAAEIAELATLDAIKNELRSKLENINLGERP